MTASISIAFSGEVEDKCSAFSTLISVAMLDDKLPQSSASDACKYETVPNTRERQNQGVCFDNKVNRQGWLHVDAASTYNSSYIHVISSMYITDFDPAMLWIGDVWC